MNRLGASVHILSLALLPFVSLAVACSSSSDSGPSGSVDAGSGTDSSAASDSSLPLDSGTGVDAQPDVTLIDSSSGDTLDPDSACGSITEQGTRTPLDIYIMFDKSSSMLGDKWNDAKSGLGVFLNDADSKGIDIAINFFPRPADSVPVCDQTAYKKPRVDFGALPGNAASIIDALDKEKPDGVSTPIYPALGGAILADIDLVKAQPGHTAIVLLVTDGEPQGPAATCSGVDPQSVTEIAALAQKGAQNSPSIRTYVIGLPGVNQSVADQIAAAGGSTQSIKVSSSDIQGEFQKALAAVRGKALPCDYVLPSKVAGGDIATDLVNVQYTKAGSTTPNIIPQIAPNAQCGSDGGWYYDNATNPSQSKPTEIILCPSTCDVLRADTTGTIQILMGCQTIVK